MQEGVLGLLRDKTRPARIAPLPAATKLAIIEKTATAKPANATHWSARKMAKVIGVSHRSVQRVWNGAGLKPHLVHTFKLHRRRAPFYGNASWDPVAWLDLRPVSLLPRRAGESMRFTAVHRLYAGRWLRNACCCRCSFCFSPAGGGRRCRHGAPPVRRLDRLALAPHGGRWQTTRPLRVRRCRAYHCPGRPLAGPRGVPLYAVWRQGWSGLCAQARRVLGGFVRGRPARGAGLRDHLCARRDIGADGTQGRSKRAAALSARAST